MPEKRIMGTLAVIDGYGFDDDPDHDGTITIIQEKKIFVPSGMMADCVMEYFNDLVSVTYSDIPGAIPLLMSIDCPAADDEEYGDTPDKAPRSAAQREMPLPDYQPVAAEAASPGIAMAERLAERRRSELAVTAISGRILGYLPVARMVQIQPESGAPVELRNWLGVGEIDFNRHLGRQARLYLSGDPYSMIVNARFLE